MSASVARVGLKHGANANHVFHRGNVHGGPETCRWTIATYSLLVSAISTSQPLASNSQGPRREIAIAQVHTLRTDCKAVDIPEMLSCPPSCERASLS